MQCCYFFDVTMNFLSSICDAVAYIHACIAYNVCTHDPIRIDCLSSLSLSLFSLFSIVCVNLPRIKTRTYRCISFASNQPSTCDLICADDNIVLCLGALLMNDVHSIVSSNHSYLLLLY